MIADGVLSGEISIQDIEEAVLERARLRPTYTEVERLDRPGNRADGARAKKHQRQSVNGWAERHGWPKGSIRDEWNDAESREGEEG